MPITMLDRNGPPEAILCPAVLCDSCGEPIHIDDRALVAWFEDGYVGRRPQPRTCLFLHMGRCDNRRRLGYTFWLPIKKFWAQLDHNLQHPFAEEAGVEYVAPAPSTWRLGHFERNAGGAR